MAFLQSAQKTLKRFIHFLLKGHRLPVFLGLLSTAFVLWLFTTPQPAISSMRERLDNLVYDQRFNLMLEAPPEAEHKIVIVDYDEKSLEAEGQWPWSRFKIGDLVAQLARYGVLVVGFDVFFPEYERNLVREFREHIGEEEDLASQLPLLETLAQRLDGDRYFAEQMQSTDVVLGIYFQGSETTAKGVLPRPIVQVDESLSESLALPEMQGYTANVDILQAGARGAGFFDTTTDIDGVIRRYPLVRQYRNRLYPSLALEMARLYFFEENFTLDTEADATGLYRSVTGIGMGSVHIPTDARAQVLVPYRGPAGSYPYISATDVLNGNLSPPQEALLQNSLVLIGTTSTGLFDLRSTPLQEVYPGVEVHANVLDAVLRSPPSLQVSREGQPALFASLAGTGVSPFPSKPDWERGAVLVVLALLGVLLSFVYPRLGPALLVSSSLAFMLGITVFNFRVWRDYHLDLSLVIILVLVLLLTVVNMGYGFLREGLSRRAIKGMFDQYVPPAHINAMLNDPDKYNFEGESKELSVLFSDIRGFTSISESLSATQLKTLLNDYFTPITGIIFENSGTIDKYVGDMVMAFWGAPMDDPAHRRHAVKAALEMLDKVRELKAGFRSRGLPEVEIGIGINSGMMNVGDMGSTYRRSYTVLGDAVNLGSRLEGLTKYYGVRCLIGEATHDELEGFLCRLVDRVQVKGKEQPIRVYEPLCPLEEASPQLRERVDAYHRALEHYLGQRWDEAEAGFRALQESDPDSGVLYGVYLERIAQLREHAPGRDWDGTFRHTSK